jgi:peptidoglycan/xylan/chitin deacetylase (PgdA/CDA1 family)
VATGVKTTGALGLKHVASLVDWLRPSRPGITVLIYHRVGGRSAVPVDLPTPLFRDQMAELADRAVSLDTALDLLAGPAPTSAGPDPVVVTFDDGTADVVDQALPVLVDHGVPALLYMATRFVDEGIDFPDNGRVASWPALADATSTGCLDLGSHTHSHALLDRLDDAAVADELDRSVELIGEHTGATAAHFAYPKALAGTAEADRLVRDRFRSAAVAGTRPNRYGVTDAWALARSPIQVADDLRWFRAKANGGLGFEDDVRRVVNRARYRGATT